MSNDGLKNTEKTFSKSKKQLILELLELEDDALGEVGKSTETNITITENKNDTIDGKEEIEQSITKPKRKLTEKQLEALKKGQQIRDENRDKMRAQKKIREDEEKRILEEKLVKKAIAVKKKQIKKQALLDEISDDDTPIQKIKEQVMKSEPKVEIVKQGPKIIYI